MLEQSLTRVIVNSLFGPLNVVHMSYLCSPQSGQSAAIVMDNASAEGPAAIQTCLWTFGCPD